MDPKHRNPAPLNILADQGKHHSSTNIEMAGEQFKSPLRHRTNVTIEACRVSNLLDCLW